MIKRGILQMKLYTFSKINEVKAINNILIVVD